MRAIAFVAVHDAGHGDQRVEDRVHAVQPRVVVPEYVAAHLVVVGVGAQHQADQVVVPDGIECDVTKHLTLSCGGQITDYGLSDNYQSDTSFSCDSYTLGFGAKLNLTARAALNVGYMWTTYEDYTKKSQNYNNTGLSGTNIYSRTNKVFGASINYRF